MTDSNLLDKRISVSNLVNPNISYCRTMGIFQKYKIGSRWNLDVANKLEESQFGILCLIKGNFDQPWILFEAGALAKSLAGSHVVPYLIDIEPVDLPVFPHQQK